MAKLKKEKKTFGMKVDEKLGTVIVALILVLYLLLMTNGYFNISITKRYCFYAICFFTIIAGLIVKLATGFKWKNIGKTPLIIAAGFEITTLIAWVRASDFSQGFWGNVEYGVGLYYFTIFIAAILVFTQFKINADVTLKFVAFVSAIEVTLAFVQFLGFDAFHLRENIGVYSPDIFISTLGNLGFFGLFTVMMLPLSIYTFVDETIKSKCIKILSIVSTSIGIIISNTDATVLAALIVFLVSFFAASKDSVKTRRYFEMLVVVGICWLALGILWQVLPNYLSNMASFYSLQKILVNPAFAVMIIAIGILGKVLIEKNILKIKAIGILGKILLGAAILVIPAIATVIAIYTINRDPYSKVDYIPMLLFRDKWGSGRGFIWHAAREMLQESSPIALIFGNGIGSFSPRFLDGYEGYAQEQMNAYFNDAHNIYLQWLYEYGLLGLIAMVSAFVVSIKKAFTSNNGFKKAAGISIIAFCVASGFLVVQCITPVFLFLMLAIVFAPEQ